MKMIGKPNMHSLRCAYFKKMKGLINMEKQLKTMIILTARIMANLVDIDSGDYTDKGCKQKLDEIEYFLSELDVCLGFFK